MYFVQNTYLDTLRKRQRPRELAEATLAQRVTFLVAVIRYGRLARDVQDTVPYVDLDVLLRHPRQLERCCHEILVLILMQVHPVK